MTQEHKDNQRHIESVDAQASAAGKPSHATRSHKMLFAVIAGIVVIAATVATVAVISPQHRQSAWELYMQNSWNDTEFANPPSDIVADFVLLDEPLYPHSPRYVPTIASIDLIPAANEGSPLPFDIGIVDGVANATSSTQTAQANTPENADENLEEFDVTLYGDDDVEITEPAGGSTNAENADVVIASSAPDDGTTTRLDGVESAIESIEDANGTVSALILNLQTGKGISYNLDEDVYSASTVKALTALYETETVLDSNEPKYDTGTITNMVEPMIRESDNDTFMSLRKNYAGSEYPAWLASLELDATIHGDDGKGWFAWYSARDAAKYWMRINQYIEGRNPHAEWLSTLFGNTNKSFIRDAAERIYSEQEEIGDSVLVSTANATVLNKAGWYNDPEREWCSTSDNGIVTTPNGKYLVSVMTNMPWTYTSEQQVTRLAESLLTAVRY